MDVWWIDHKYEAMMKVLETWEVYVVHTELLSQTLSGISYRIEMISFKVKAC